MLPTYQHIVLRVAYLLKLAVQHLHFNKNKLYVLFMRTNENNLEIIIINKNMFIFKYETV